jgi:WD40 repeat protein
MSWDQNTAAASLHQIYQAAWSPCSQSIAIASADTSVIDILDSATFQKLQVLKSPQEVSREPRVLIFSPDSCVLTSCGCIQDLNRELFVISWDLQTGGVVSTIRWQGPEQRVLDDPSITYSANGKMVGILCCYRGDPNIATISICHVASGMRMHSHSLDISFPFSNNIWTHGESLQFITTNTTTITIWEVGFTLGNTPTEVETLPVPDEFDPAMFCHINSCRWKNYIWILPFPFRLACVFQGKVLVWDVWNSKCLLQCTDISFFPMMSFSSNGHFFACSTTRTDIYLWKELPTGYVLHKVLAPRDHLPCPLLSPNGESIAVLGDRMVWLWHTNSFITCPSKVLTKAPHFATGFVLDISHGMLAMVVIQESDMVIVLNLKSGVLHLTIDTDMEVHGLRVIENTIVAIGSRKVIAWDLPVRGCVPNVRVGFEDRSWSIDLHGLEGKDVVSRASISPDFRHIAIISHIELQVYSASTGEQLGYGPTRGLIPCFTPDGCGLWCVTHGGEVEVWRVGGGQNVLKRLEHEVDIECPPEGYPWASSQGYWVTDDWWILGPDGKRLLMLPPVWQACEMHQIWTGQFLVLQHLELPEPVVLELEL